MAPVSCKRRKLNLPRQQQCGSTQGASPPNHPLPTGFWIIEERSASEQTRGRPAQLWNPSNETKPIPADEAAPTTGALESVLPRDSDFNRFVCYQSVRLGEHRQKADGLPTLKTPETPDANAMNNGACSRNESFVISQRTQRFARRAMRTLPGRFHIGMPQARSIDFRRLFDFTDDLHKKARRRGHKNRVQPTVFGMDRFCLKRQAVVWCRRHDGTELGASHSRLVVVECYACLACASLRAWPSASSNAGWLA